MSADRCGSERKNKQENEKRNAAPRTAYGAQKHSEYKWSSRWSYSQRETRAGLGEVSPSERPILKDSNFQNSL